MFYEISVSQPVLVHVFGHSQRAFSFPPTRADCLELRCPFRFSKIVKKMFQQKIKIPKIYIHQDLYNN